MAYFSSRIKIRSLSSNCVRTYEDRNWIKNATNVLLVPRPQSYGRFFYLSKSNCFLIVPRHIRQHKILSSTLWRIKFRGQSRGISRQVICIWLQPATTFTPTPDSKPSQPVNKYIPSFRDRSSKKSTCDLDVDFRLMHPLRGAVKGNGASDGQQVHPVLGGVIR